MIKSRKTPPLHQRTQYAPFSTLPKYLEVIKQRMINHPREAK